MTEGNRWTIALVVTLIIAVANIVNQWLLARYNKKEAIRATSSPAEDSPKATARIWRSRGLLYLMVAMGIWNIARPFWNASDVIVYDALRIALGIGSIIFALTIHLFHYMNGIMNDMVRVLGKAVDSQGDLTGVTKSINSSHVETSRKLNVATNAVIGTMKVLHSMDLTDEQRSTIQNELKSMEELYRELTRDSEPR